MVGDDGIDHFCLSVTSPEGDSGSGYFLGPLHRSLTGVL